MYDHGQTQDMESDEKIEEGLRSSLEVLIERDNPMSDAAERALELYG